MNLHQILREAWIFLCGNYLEDLEGCSHGWLAIGRFIMITRPLMHHVSCRVFWQNIKSPRWLRPTTAQIWRPETSGFPPNSNHLWKGRDFDCRWDAGKNDRAANGDWENSEVPSAYFEEDWGIIVLCTMFLVSSSMNGSTFHITWLGTFWTDLVICVKMNWAISKLRDLEFWGGLWTGSHGKDLRFWEHISSTVETVLTSWGE